MQMAAMLLWRICMSRCPWGVSARTDCTGSHLQFITGWWLTMSSQCCRTASAATSSVMSRATSTRVTSAAGSPSSWPTLSQSMAPSLGARR